MVFPRKGSKPKAGDASAEELSTAAQAKGSRVMPVTKAAAVLEKVALTAEMKAAGAYSQLRLERMNARLVGVRAKRTAEAEAAEKDAAA